MSKDKLIEKTLEIEKDLSGLNQDKINELAPPEPEEKWEDFNRHVKERCKLENALFIEPTRRLPKIGKLPEKLKKEHRRDWEYIKAMVENQIINGEPIQFWFCKYPGDEDMLWSIPCNKPVYIPRMIAKHLEETPQYHKFEYKERQASDLRSGEFIENFTPTQTERRYRCRPIGAFE